MAAESTDDDGLTAYILRGLDGEEKLRVPTLDVATVSRTLAVRGERVVITGVVVHIRAEMLRWRVCEAWPPPFFIKCVSAYHVRATWFFICENCRDVNPNFAEYTNINFEGVASTASSEADY